MSGTSTTRLQKYAARGFGIIVPGFIPSMISRHARESTYVYIENYDLLLCLSSTTPINKVIQVTSLTSLELGIQVSSPRLREARPIQMYASVMHNACVVKGLLRLVVMDPTMGFRLVRTCSPQLIWNDESERLMMTTKDHWTNWFPLC